MCSVVREIPLTQGKVAIVDDEDYERLRRLKWHAHQTRHGHWYAESGGSPTKAGRTPLRRMHREVLPVLPCFEVDHVNGNGLDNRRTNLRSCTTSENQHNQTVQIGGSSAYKGVHWSKPAHKWVSSIRVHDHPIYIGLFRSEEEAARAYDIAARHYFGEFARVNFP